MADAPETPLLDGARAWAESQAAFQTVPNPTRTFYYEDAVWYDTIEDDNEGAFCLVREDSPLQELVGEVVWVRYNLRTALLYCIGTSNALPTNIALQRAAFFHLAALDRSAITLSVRGTL